MANAPRVTDEPSTDQLLALDNQLCFALHAASRQIVRAYRPVLGPLDLTYPQYLVLLVLWERANQPDFRPSVRALGERLDLDSGTLTPLLKRLEEKGLLHRSRAKDDERELHVRLTAEGCRLKNRAAEIPRAALRNPPLPLAEMSALRGMLQRLRNAMTEHVSADGLR
jgi:DNA-binding MarR family transcriptional regulator